MTTPRILIVDDHALAREGLKSVLGRGGFDIVGEAASGEEAVALAQQCIPDVVLMDVRLGPGIDGLEATRRIVSCGLPTRVLMLTLHDVPEYVREALAAGASGYVLKDTAIEELRRAIEAVTVGQTFLPQGLIQAAMQPAPIDRKSDADLKVLTERERDVLRLVADGKTNKAIARDLMISPATVKAHVERIIGKLGVADRTQAAVIAARQDRS